MGIVPDQHTDGTASFFSNRQPAWHTLGTVTKKALTAEEALKQAKLLTPVTKVPVFALVGEEYIEIEDKWATGSLNPVSSEWRTHGVVGSNYEVVQNAEQFEVLDAIRDESDAVYETAGAIGNGRVVFVTMKLPETMKFNGQDVVDLYLMAMNSHDGTKAFTLAVTPVRVVCQNTLNAAVRSAHRVFKIKHTRNAKYRIQEAREALDLTFSYVEAFEEQVQKLIAQDMSDKKFADYVDKFLRISDKTEKAVTRANNSKLEILDIWNSPTTEVAGKNAWGAYNAVTEWLDWGAGVRVKKAKNDTEARALRVISKRSENKKTRAMQLLVK